ncbi:MAG: hypothetical protein FWD68_11325 [Alphaproteobacteria bacterium]|nr:hypothetical protein [Alphaproteobacteria bacterium]
MLQLGPSPLQRNTPPPNDLEKLSLIAQGHDVARVAMPATGCGPRRRGARAAA